MSEEDDGPNLIHTTNLENYLREISEEETQVGTDAKEYMEIQIENICREVWKEAEENTLDRDAKRVTEEDLRTAFDEVFYPYALLEESITKLGEYQLELERTADEYPILDFQQSEDEQ